MLTENQLEMLGNQIAALYQEMCIRDRPYPDTACMHFLKR